MGSPATKKGKRKGRGGGGPLAKRRVEGSTGERDAERVRVPRAYGPSWPAPSNGPAAAAIDSVLVCPFPGCGRHLATKMALRYHSRRHKKATHPCGHEGCDRMFITASKRTRHEQVHTKARPYACLEPECGKSFRHRHSLEAHREAHATGDQKTLYCLEADCPKMFATREGLRAHTRVHAQNKPCACTWAACNKTFRYPGELAAHTRTHDQPGAAVLKCPQRWPDGSRIIKVCQNRGALANHQRRRDHARSDTDPGTGVVTGTQ